MLEDADLPEGARAIAQRIFRRLAEAEAVVHHRDLEQVVFHEVGAVDSIVDIIGTALALDQLRVERVFASPVPTGMGMMKTEHGSMPIPAPAVVELLRGAPLYLPQHAHGAGDTHRRRDPRLHGRGLRRDAARSAPNVVGYGAGTLRPDFPNVLRVLVGEGEPGAILGTGGDPMNEPSVHSMTDELVLSTNVDDLNPELYAYVLERLFAAGAQDAWLTPIVMKKGRPAATISVLCARERADALRRVLFRETGTLGIRTTATQKLALEREWVEVETRHGRVRVKVGRLEGRPVTVAPEFEDCVAVARESNVPARDVYEEAVRLARARLEGSGD